MPRREKPIPRSQRISFNRGTKISRNSPAVKDDVKDLRSMGRFNGDPSIGIGVTKIRGENTVVIIEKVKTKIKSDIEPTLPLV